jgi:hypothetical protein
MFFSNPYCQTKRIIKNIVAVFLIRFSILFCIFQAGCLNCQDLLNKLEKSKIIVKEKDNAICELQLLCAKFEKQLGHSDKLMEHLAQSKGYKGPGMPK